ncbi:hypothetical protein DU508_17915 [Pedobacter chinensis]|uniref:Uncharacterized protein n=1 Tax=Pedobacter chinensis TaxID=2282421 RepID=A0A369PRU3_9SPHI|nr:hypothetical protein DU508_17915 [Pedobacter chinensis]
MIDTEKINGISVICGRKTQPTEIKTFNSSIRYDFFNAQLFTAGLNDPYRKDLRNQRNLREKNTTD